MRFRPVSIVLRNATLTTEGVEGTKNRSNQSPLRDPFRPLGRTRSPSLSLSQRSRAGLVNDVATRLGHTLSRRFRFQIRRRNGLDTYGAFGSVGLYYFFVAFPSMKVIQLVPSMDVSNFML